MTLEKAKEELVKRYKYIYEKNQKIIKIYKIKLFTS